MIRPTSSRSCARLPGPGRAAWRTCQRRSNRGSSVQEGLESWIRGVVGDPLAEPRHEGEACRDVLEELLERRRSALEDQGAADVDVDRPALGQQRGHVGGREPLHRGERIRV